MALEVIILLDWLEAIVVLAWIELIILLDCEVDEDDAPPLGCDNNTAACTPVLDTLP